MNLSVLVMLLPWLLIALGIRLFYQLVRQNGRILLRLEAIEDRLEHLADVQPGGRHSSNGRRPLSESKIERNGLPEGTPAPDFRLPKMNGGELSLSDFKGRRVLLIFSDPHCGPCDALMPDLEKVHRQIEDFQVIMVSRGEIGENRKKAKEHGLTFPIVLQKKWEVSKLYAMFATPISYLIDEEGVIAAEVAVGAEAIIGLLSGTPTSNRELEPVA